MRLHILLKFQSIFWETHVSRRFKRTEIKEMDGYTHPPPPNKKSGNRSDGKQPWSKSYQTFTQWIGQAAWTSIIIHFYLRPPSSLLSLPPRHSSKLKLGHRLRRWTNNKPVMGERVVFREQVWVQSSRRTDRHVDCHKLLACPRGSG